MNYLVVYDICAAKRLRRVEKLMRSYGYRVQKSVFECDMDAKTLQHLQNRADNLIDEEKDSIRVYPLPGQARQEQVILGQGELAPIQKTLFA